MLIFRVNKFKELYFKNEKLRKELKLLNEKLNEKLEKLKLPSVKKKAMSVDLNHNPPSSTSFSTQKRCSDNWRTRTNR